jgi:hypothetical protein
MLSDENTISYPIVKRKSLTQSNKGAETLRFSCALHLGVIAPLRSIFYAESFA